MKYLILSFLIISVFLVVGAHSYNIGAARSEGSSYIKIHNPFDSDFSIDLKCNWDGKKWKNLKRYKLKARDGTEIEVPNSSRCQIWPVF